MTEEKKVDPNIEAIEKLIEPGWPIDELRKIDVQHHLNLLKIDLNHYQTMSKIEKDRTRSSLYDKVMRVFPILIIVGIIPFMYWAMANANEQSNYERATYMLECQEAQLLSAEKCEAILNGDYEGQIRERE